MFSEFAHDHGQPTPWEYAIYGGGELVTGTLLKVNTDALNKGRLIKAVGPEMPDYIAMSSGTFVTGDQIAVIPVKAGKKYRTIATDVIATPHRGSMHQIHVDGIGITAEAENGHVELVAWDGPSISAGDEVIVQFK